jgi:hypothetical protein
MWCITAFTRDNGPLRVIPGSHRVSEPPIDMLAFGSGMGPHPDEVKIVAPAGSVIMFNSADPWHFGTFSYSPAPRLAVTAGFRRATAHRSDCCRSIRRRGGVKGRFACTLTRHPLPVLVALRPDRPLMPYRRRITIRWQSGGGPGSFPGHRGPAGHRETGRWSPQPNNVRGSSPHPRFAAGGPHRGVARLAGMRRILLGGIAAVLLLAVGTRAADALGIGGPRLRCGCTETCWCQRPGLTVFRWVTPGRWHHIGLTAEEKRSRHSQA